MPENICGSAICSIDNNIYIIGGGTTIMGDNVFSSVFVYNLKSDSWSIKTPMPTARGFASAAVVDGKIYVMGGSSDGLTKVYNILEVYDPDKDLWVIKANMPTARTCLTTTVVDGIIYAIGGTVNAPWPGLKIVEAYDPKNDTWTSKAQMHDSRWSHTSSVLNGKIYVIGGDNVYNNNYNELTSVEEYNPVTNTWETKTPMHWERAGLVSGVIEGRIYAIGGGFHQSIHDLIILSAVEEYNPTLDPTDVEDLEKSEALLTEFNLYQNYPNPFNPLTKIRYSVPQSSTVVIKVFDILGNEIETLVNVVKPAGSYELNWNAENLPSDVYFCKMQSGNFVETKKMILVK